MRITVVSPGAGRTTRGYEVFATQLVQHLRAAGVEVQFLTGGPTQTVESCPVRSLDRAGFVARKLSRVLGVATTSIEQYSFSIPAIYRIRGFCPEVVIGSESVLFGIWARLRPLFGKRPPLFILTNGGSRVPPFNAVDGVIHHAPDLCERARREEPNRVHEYLPCPIEVPGWLEVVQERRKSSSVKEELGIPTDRSVVVVVGAIDRSVKRVHYIAREVSELIARSSEVHLLLIGREEPSGKRLVSEMSSILSGRLTVIEVPSRSIGRYLASSDIYVSASLREGYGRSMVEALAWGTPAIVHKANRTRSLLGWAVQYVDARVPGQLSEALAEALSRSWDSRSAQARWTLASSLSWDQLGAEYAETIAKIALDE